MNFRKKEPVVDLDELDRALARPADRSTKGPEAYAQPHIRNNPDHPAQREWRNLEPVFPAKDETLSVIETFEELPTKEIDEILKAARAEMASIEDHANAVKRMHAEHVAQIRADVERLRENIKLAGDTFNALRDQIIALDQARNGKRAEKEKNKKPSSEPPKLEATE